MPLIDWDKLVNEGRAIARNVPLPDGITHISQMEHGNDDDVLKVQKPASVVPGNDEDMLVGAPKIDLDLPNALTKREMQEILKAKNIEFKPNSTAVALMELIHASNLERVDESKPEETTGSAGSDEESEKKPLNTDGNDSDII